MHLSLNNAVNLHLYRLQLLRPACVLLFAGHLDKLEAEQGEREMAREGKRQRDRERERDRLKVSIQRRYQ